MNMYFLVYSQPRLVARGNLMVVVLEKMTAILPRDEIFQFLKAEPVRNGTKIYRRTALSLLQQ